MARGDPETRKKTTRRGVHGESALPFTLRNNKMEGNHTKIASAIFELLFAGEFTVSAYDFC